MLKGVQLDIPQGDFVALMGPSGSGKTTLLNLIGGLDEPASGTLTVAGERVDDMNGAALSRWRSRNIGFVFQLYNLLPVLTAERNVELPLLLTKLSKVERRKRGWKSWASSTACITIRGSCPEGRSSGWGSHGRS